jgi:hypothetical protein
MLRAYTPLVVVSRARSAVSTLSTTAPIGTNLVVHGKRALWPVRESFIGSSLTSNTGINDISIKLKQQNHRNSDYVWVSEHFSKMLVLSGVFNSRILDATNYANPRLYACQLQTYIYLRYTLTWSNRQPIKKRPCFLPGYGPIAIADWSIIVHCNLLVKLGF